MTIRTILGASWSLAVGLAGGWLMLSPWALGEQASGSWTPVTQTEFFTGLGLVVLSLLGLVLVALQALQGLRQAGVIAGRPSAPAGSRQEARDGAAARASEASSEEFESALVGLAQALTRELQASPASPPEGASNAAPHPARRQEV
jgi:hypothetical protein